MQPKRAVPREDTTSPGSNLSVKKIYIAGIRGKPIEKASLQRKISCASHAGQIDWRLSVSIRLLVRLSRIIFERWNYCFWSWNARKWHRKHDTMSDDEVVPNYRSTPQEDLEEYFKTFGNVVDCQVLMDEETGKNRGFAFVMFDDFDSGEHWIRQMSIPVSHKTDDLILLSRGIFWNRLWFLSCSRQSHSPKVSHDLQRPPPR